MSTNLETRMIRKLYFSVQTHYQRIFTAKKLIDQIEVEGHSCQLNVDNTDFYKNKQLTTDGYDKYAGQRIVFRKTFDAYPEQQWVIYAQEDIILSSYNLFAMQRILEIAPTHSPICFYHPTNKKYRQFPSADHKVGWTNEDVWIQCTAFPQKIREGFKDWYDSEIEGHITNLGDDRLITTYMCLTKQSWYVIVPSVVQHDLRVPSVLGHPSKTAGNRREAFDYDPNFDGSQVNWENEFLNAYCISKQRTFGRLVF